MAQANGENTHRSRSFAFIARFCARHRQIGVTRPLRCSNDHNEEDAKLYDVSDPNVLQKLLRNGAKINMKHCLTGETPLHCAVITRKGIRLVIEFLKNGADVNSADIKGFTPLHTAILTKNFNVIECLIHYGANINRISSSQGENTFGLPDIRLSPLDLAVRKLPLGKLVIMHTLLRYSDRVPRTVIDMKPYKRLRFYGQLSSFMHTCVSEIKKMKCTRVNESLSLYDFIMDIIRCRKLQINTESTLFSIPHILQALQNYPYEVFRDFIIEGIGRIELMKELNHLYEYVRKYTKKEKKEMFLDLHSVYAIIDYLTNEEIANFLTALYLRDNAKQSLPLQKDESLSTQKNLGPFAENDNLSTSTKDTLKSSTEKDVLSQCTGKDALSQHTGKDSLSQCTGKDTLSPSTGNYAIIQSSYKNPFNQSNQENPSNLFNQENPFNPSNQNNPFNLPTQENSFNFSTPKNSFSLSTPKNPFNMCTQKNLFNKCTQKNFFNLSLSQSTKNDNLRRSTTIKNNLIQLTLQKDASKPSTTKDTLNPSTKKESLKPSTKKDSIKPSNTKDTLTPSTSNDTLKHSSSNDTLKPSTSNDTLKPSTSKVFLKPSLIKYDLKPSTKEDTLKPSTKKFTSCGSNKIGALSEAAEENTASPSSQKHTLSPEAEDDTASQSSRRHTLCPGVEDVNANLSSQMRTLSTSTKNDVACFSTETVQFARVGRSLPVVYQIDPETRAPVLFVRRSNRSRVGPAEGSVERPKASNAQPTENPAKRRKLSHF